MDLKLEGIVETLLVGAMGSLLVLSFIFFAFGHIWNVRVMRRFFDTLFRERQTGATNGERSGAMPAPPDSQGVPSHVPEAAAESSRAMASQQGFWQVKKETGDEGHAKFGGILLLSLLYGLGIITEAASHHFLKDANKEARHRSFESVAVGKVASGTASRRLEGFVSDYEACRAPAAQKLRKADPLSLCNQVETRAIEFFYNAKNVVYQHRDYYEELSALESRINFMRSFELLSRLFLIELGVVFVIALIAEIGNRRFRSPWRRFVDRHFLKEAERLAPEPGAKPKRRSLRGEWRHGALKLGEHWVGIAAFHILLLVAASSLLWWFSLLGSGYAEDQYSKRVFGYYLALAPGGDEPVEGGQGAKGDAESDVTPESPYHMFSLLPSKPEPEGRGAGREQNESQPFSRGDQSAKIATNPMATARLEEPGPPSALPAKESGTELGGPSAAAHGQRRLEPSAVQILGSSSQVLVASDQGEDKPFWLFTLDEHGTRLDNPRPVELTGEGRKQLGKVLGDGTIEALAAFEPPQGGDWVNDQKDCLADKDHKTFRVFAGPSHFDSDASLLSFCLSINGEEPQIHGVQRVRLPSLSGFCDKASCAGEGIAFRTDTKGRPELLLGLQGVDANSLAIVRIRKPAIDPHDVAKWAVDKILSMDAAGCRRDESIKTMLKDNVRISDLAAAPSGRIYVTTSFQSTGAAHAPVSQSASPTPEVGGALWLVDLGCTTTDTDDVCRCAAQKAILLDTFIHKPDGITHDNGSVLIVFDDEGRRKSRQWAPRTFPLGQNEAVFAVVPSPEFQE
jgi:hypothetical protein